MISKSEVQIIVKHFFNVTQMDVNFDSCLRHLQDEVAEWLRRWTANPLGSARAGSNPVIVEIF